MVMVAGQYEGPLRGSNSELKMGTISSDVCVSPVTVSSTSGCMTSGMEEKETG